MAFDPISLLALPALLAGSTVHFPPSTPPSHPSSKGATVGSAEKTAADATKFAIGFDHRDRTRLFELWTEVLDSEQWSEGSKLEAFEQRWAEWNGLPSLGLSSWAGGALAALEFAGVKGETVLCPSNTFMASPLAAIGAGAEVEFVDCNREDLCMSFADFEAKAERHKPRAAILVHIGGHISFDAGLNFRMSEFTAALALVQAERMEEIVAWKNEHARQHLDPVHPARLQLPEGMTSGYYKYIVFEELEKSTGKVYDQPCHRIMGRSDELPNTDWVAENHWCVPLYYRPESRAAALYEEEA